MGKVYVCRGLSRTAGSCLQLAGVYLMQVVCSLGFFVEGKVLACAGRNIFASMANDYACPNCGSPLKTNRASSRMVGCPYCGQTSYILGTNLSAQGKPVLLADFGSEIKTGATLEIGSQRFRVNGRVRFDYPDGFWDEWWLEDLAAMGQDALEYWLQESEGEWVLFKAEVPIPGVNKLAGAVGDWVQVSEHKLFVTEIRNAVVHGTEGELPYQLVAGDTMEYLDGLEGGNPVSVECMDGEVTVFAGIHLDYFDIKVRELYG